MAMARTHSNQVHRERTSARSPRVTRPPQRPADPPGPADRRPSPTKQPMPTPSPLSPPDAASPSPPDAARRRQTPPDAARRRQTPPDATTALLTWREKGRTNYESWRQRIKVGASVGGRTPAAATADAGAAAPATAGAATTAKCRRRSYLGQSRYHDHRQKLATGVRFAT